MKKISRILAENIDKSSRKAVGNRKTIIGSIPVPAELLPVSAKKSE